MSEDPSIKSYTASLVSQGEHRFYTLTVPAEVLARTCFVTTREEDPEEGFQCLLSKSRAQDIADYIDSGLGTIPTSVVLSAQREAGFEYSSKNRTVSFKDVEDAFLILDGQHRVYGFRLAKSDLRVPVVIYAGLSKKDETRLFIDINTKQKPVPNELLLDIRKLANYQDDSETILGQIFDLFDTEPGNPLMGKMSPRARKKNLISRVTFNSAVKPLLPLFKEATPLQIFEILSAYYSSVLRQIKVQDLKIDITSPIAFRGITGAFPDIAQRVNDKFGKDYTVENFDDINKEIYDKLRIASLRAASSSVKAYTSVIQNAMRPRSIF
jgi:DGQHR domain-containing protein